MNRDDVDLLAGVPLLRDLAGELVHRLAAAVTHVRLRADEVLFAQGEPGDTFYVVRTGRIQVLVDGTVERELGRGAAFGELALLSGGRRTATARARRDTELIAIGRDAFDHVLDADPAFARALVGQLGLWLRRGDLPAAPARRCTVLALVPAQPSLPELEVTRVADLLHAELRGSGTRVARLDDTEAPDRWAHVVDAAEASHDVVLLCATRSRGAWTEFCRRQGDRVLTVVDPTLGGPSGELSRRGELVPLGQPRSGGQGLRLWLGTSGTASVHHVDLREPTADIARLARRVTGRSLGLVLSGGGARGLAHIGVVEALQRAGVLIDRVGGTSMGSVVAGMVAIGASASEMLDIARRELVARRPFTDVVWPRHALLRGTRAEATLGRVFGTARIEEQRCAMFAVSVDLLAAEPVVHRTGRIADAVSLSVRIPGIAPPRWAGRRLHVDGGVLDNMPVGVMAASGEGPVLASDVAQVFDDLAGAGRPGRLPKMIDTIGRSMTLASSQRTEAERSLARAVITPDLGSIGMFDFRRLDELVDRGRESAEKALAELGGALAPA